MTNTIKTTMKKGFWFLIIALLIIPKTNLLAQTKCGGVSQSMETPFNLGEVMEKVSHHPVREGDGRVVTLGDCPGGSEVGQASCLSEQSEKIVIKDRVYQAFFDEKGVVLKVVGQ
ncbi:MAG: hypothetical protein AB1393_12815, partial [Candidatus Edwardsbacteria bacterium]